MNEKMISKHSVASLLTIRPNIPGLNMTDKVKQTRTPRDLAAITNGAIKLPLKDRVQLVKELQQVNADEVQALRKAADEATAIVAI